MLDYRTLPLALVAALACASDAHAQTRSDAQRAAAEGAFRGAMNAGLEAFCMKAADDDQTAITLRVELLSASRLLSADATRTPAGIHLGPYVYEGRGVVLTSDDPRFQDIVVDPTSAVPRLPNGDALIVSNILPARQGGQCRLALTPRFEHESPGTLRAAHARAAPVLAGYRAGASWPDLPTGFIGLMQPESGADETLIVTFDAGADPRTEVLARLPLSFQSLVIVPRHHGVGGDMRLTGRQSNGSLIDLALRIPPAAP